MPPHAIFCLEVHGEPVCMDLPCEARQLYMCHDIGTSSSSIPPLRVGRRHQQKFWQRVLRPDVSSGEHLHSMMAEDHFEIAALPRRRVSADGDDLRFRLQVSRSAASVFANSSVAVNAGDRTELQHGDVLSIGVPCSNSAGVRATPDASAMHAGLRLTFVLAGRALRNGRAPEQPRQLPEIHALWDDEAAQASSSSGSAAVKVAANHYTAQQTPSVDIGTIMLPANGKAGALRPPTCLPSLDTVDADPEPACDEGDLQETIDNGAPVHLQSNEGAFGKQNLTSPIDPDDLFSRTGFQPGNSAGEASPLQAGLCENSDSKPATDQSHKSHPSAAATTFRC